MPPVVGQVFEHCPCCVCSGLTEQRAEFFRRFATARLEASDCAFKHHRVVRVVGIRVGAFRAFDSTVYYSIQIVVVVHTHHNKSLLATADSVFRRCGAFRSAVREFIVQRLFLLEISITIMPLSSVVISTCWPHARAFVMLMAIIGRHSCTLIVLRSVQPLNKLDVANSSPAIPISFMVFSKFYQQSPALGGCKFFKRQHHTHK